MPLAFQSRIYVCVRNLPIERKTKEVCEECIENDWEGTLVRMLAELQEHDRN
jgi:hypothetical protein